MDLHNTVEDCFLKPNCNISSCSSKTIISNKLPKILLIAICLQLAELQRLPLLFIGIGTNVDNNKPLGAIP